MPCIISPVHTVNRRIFSDFRPNQFSEPTPENIKPTKEIYLYKTFSSEPLSVPKSVLIRVL